MVDRPPIPFTCAHRPTIGGLVKPWINVELADGGVDFRGRDRRRAELAVAGRLCQVCGTAGSGGQPAHPWYAVYTHRYTWARDQHGALLVLVDPGEVRNVRLVSQPGEGRRWRTVPDALANYEAPEFLQVRHG